MAEDVTLLLTRLRSYSAALDRHTLTIQQAYDKAQESYEHLRRVWGGNAAQEFYEHWDRTTEAFERYLTGARRIKETLDARIESLAEADRPMGERARTAVRGQGLAQTDGREGVGVDRGDGRDVLGQFVPSGARRYGAAEEAQGLRDYSVARGRDVIDVHVRATLPDGSTRYYDGLALKPDGTYEGIEVKSGSADRTPPQKIFDKRVDGGGRARAVLYGQPIVITSTYKVNV